MAQNRRLVTVSTAIMKQVIVLIVCLVLGFQQVFGASEQELEDALDQLSDLVNSVIGEIGDARTNFSNAFSDILVKQRTDAEQQLKTKQSEITDKIAKVTASGDGLENVNVTVCGSQVLNEIQDYADRIVKSLETCVYDTKFSVAGNLMTAEWIEITKVGGDYMRCAGKTIQNCGGDATCGDAALATIQAQIDAVPNALKSIAAAMFNTQDGYNADCTEQYLTDFDYYVTDMLRFVTSCVNIILKGSLLPVCAVAVQ